MTTVADILQFVQTLAPLSRKMEWDNVGLNCGRMDRPVTKILVALDPFTHVCREAKAIGADLLVTHHALIWKPGFVTDQTVQGSNTLFLIENGIAHINAHTNLDCADGGVNDVLADKLGLADISPVPGDDYTLLRMGQVTEQPLSDFLASVKENLCCHGLRYVDSGKPVRKVAVGGGACASEMDLAISAGCDTFVTSDIKYNQFWDAKNAGLNLIDAGHFYTENPVVAIVAAKIGEAFPEIEVKISETHDDCMRFY